MDDLEKKHRCQGHADIGERHARLQSPVAVSLCKRASLILHTIPLSSSCLVFLLLRSTGCRSAQRTRGHSSQGIFYHAFMGQISARREDLMRAKRLFSPMRMRFPGTENRAAASSASSGYALTSRNRNRTALTTMMPAIHKSDTMRSEL